MIVNYSNDSFKLKNIDRNENRIANSTFNLNIELIRSDFQEGDRTLFVVLPNLFDATKYYEALQTVIEPSNVLFYPADEVMISSLAISSKDFKFERLNTINTLLENKKSVVVTNINGLIRVNVNKERWEKESLSLEKGKTYNINYLKEALSKLGYHHTSLTEQPGEYSTRGSIIDFYPINMTDPVRLDFFDDELEAIKAFSPSTQRSYKELKNVIIRPYTELFFTSQEREELINYLKSQQGLSLEEQTIISNNISDLDLNHNLDQLVFYHAYFDKMESIISFASDKKIYLINEDKILYNLENIVKKNRENYEEIGSKVLVKYPLFLDYQDVIKEQALFYVDNISKGKGKDYHAEEILPFFGKLDKLVLEVAPKFRKEFVIFSLTNLSHQKIIKDKLLEELVPYKTIKDIKDAEIGVINIIDVHIPSMYLPQERIYIVDDLTIFPARKEKRKIRFKSTFNEGKEISYYQDLEAGDYIVHLNHGIAKYEGIKTIELSKRKRDYLSLLYAGGEHLYIPIEQLSLIKKYVGREGVTPELTRLGSGKWNKQKEKILARVNELSAQLVKLYAERERAVGHQFKPDDELQKQFEQEFLYQETPDQLAAIEATKKDMESTKPMDRLICGDVGYGKTEVALRAAFKACLDGMQVCYLAPTTILARQHYYTFKERMEHFGLRVELLSRFVSGKKQKEVLASLAKGTVDVLIGTHRVISKDVVFKNLGLLITDEEQRFGVGHKEEIKKMRVNVDSLMLSATPIPRTLQMSLVGIKELSLIETPPENRYPIQTYVIPRNETIIKEAIERELIRHGQVFYLYNFTEDIEDKADEISALVPEARVAYVHGKMNKVAIENIVSKFIDHEYDVLVSTTIIETGIDIPEANTLIIHDADRLGLSQLYQIRGRVGRSDKIAYAYLMYEPRKDLTDNAKKRLDAIKEFTELGSGFKIAMRDLAIRGAGDLLGEEQSGFIDTVGLETYMQILDNAIKKEEAKTNNLAKNNISYNANKSDLKITKILSDRFIPEEYQLDEGIKFEIHDQISKIKTMDDINNLTEEFEDRFGRVDDSLKAYMYEKLFINLLEEKGVSSVDFKPSLLTIVLSKEKSDKIDGEKLYKKAYKLADDFNLVYKNYQITIYLKLQRYQNGLWLIPACELLNTL